MLTHCPFCQQPIPFTADQLARLDSALAQLPPGKLLTLKCPHCRDAITLDQTGQPPQKSAGPVVPPPPPNLDWLQNNLFQSDEKVEDVPMALVLHQANEQRHGIGEALEAVGYQVFMADTVDDAMERMRFVTFSCIVFQANLEGSLERSHFHAHMRKLPMDRRRYIFYILLGEQFHTLYDLEALAFSANLTVNTGDLGRLDLVLRKAIPAYEELFGPILEELNVHGKR